MSNPVLYAMAFGGVETGRKRAHDAERPITSGRMSGFTELFARPAASPLDELSPRHREVLELVAQGRTNAQIARELYVSRATLERLVSQISNVSEIYVLVICL